MSSILRPFPLLFTGVGVLSLIVTGSALGYVKIATAKLVTNTKNGSNEMVALDKKGQVAVFVSNSDHLAGVAPPATGAFDYDGAGNGFASGAAPSPSCTNCLPVDENAGNLYLWRLKKKGDQPANSIRQLTSSATGGFDANSHPDMDSKAQWVAWTSDQDHLGSNNDGNSEIFLVELDTDTIMQVTHTMGGGDKANRTATISDKGRFIAFDSTRDYAEAGNCKRPDGTTACSNPDHNSEVMFYDREAGTFTQVTDTSGDGNDAHEYPRISIDASHIVFKSTRSFAGVLGGGVTCVGSTGGCANDSNGEIMLYEIGERILTQVTDTINQAGCNDKTSNERPEVSKKGKYVVFQSECEEQLNAAGCGRCNGNDEVFYFETKKGEISQVTISDAGWNRVPRIAPTGSYIAWDTNRSYFGLNASHNEKLFIMKRGSTKPRAGLTAKMQVVEDEELADLNVVQHPRSQATTIQFDGGFPGSERIGISGNGRHVAFESSKNVGNQEIWLVDRNRCDHAYPDCL
ncbi:MAG: hypothetical protein P8R42_27805 [Candidatus Binatia bacterium]|nr:hypothetical protein [Candidatus Binatia bacterium]